MFNYKVIYFIYTFNKIIKIIKIYNKKLFFDSKKNVVLK